MCLSGQCQLSAVLGSRSGNRGLCAQPCRLPFSAEGGTGHDLSLKDMSLIEYLPELAQMGITSFKIEGRMKRPEYVAAAVTACKRVLRARMPPAMSARSARCFPAPDLPPATMTALSGAICSACAARRT